MAKNWRLHRTIAFVVLGFLAAGLLGLFEIGEKAFNFIEWKWLMLAGVGYVAWAFKNLLNM